MPVPVFPFGYVLTSVPAPGALWYCVGLCVGSGGAVRRLSPWETQITLDRKLKWRHMGVRVADGMGGTVDERAEVALLSRNIMITGLVEGGDLRYEGGHFIVHQTSAPQIIEGVEFFRLGQQGNLGRYSIHFHVCADVRRRSRVYKNSVHDSNQVRT